MRKLLMSGLLLFSFSGCNLENLIYPGIPMGSVQIEPMPEYFEWWGELEACTGRNRDLKDVTWWKVPIDDSQLHLAYCSDKETGCSGWYDPYRSRIYIIETALEDREVVGHEIKHALGLDHGDDSFKNCN